MGTNRRMSLEEREQFDRIVQNEHLSEIRFPGGERARQLHDRYSTRVRLTAQEEQRARLAQRPEAVLGEVHEDLLHRAAKPEDYAMNAESQRAIFAEPLAKHIAIAVEMTFVSWCP
jgi:hypothetical protein